MTAFADRVSALTGVAAADLRRLAGGDLSEVLLVPRDGRSLVAKSGSGPGDEARMLRLLADAGMPVPAVHADYEDVLLLDFVENDGAFTAAAWADIGAAVARLHARTGAAYGWPGDYQLASVRMDNREGRDWPVFWGEQRLVATAALLDRPWRTRIDAAARRLGDLLPSSPPASLLHGDLWSGNLLVSNGRLAAMIDPACYHGHCEVDLAMLTLFDTPPPAFLEAYGALAPGWEERRPAYQLFPALVHLRLFGDGYAAMVDRLLRALGA